MAVESNLMGARTPAVVAFVKTPGLSPVKTRLARTLGRECAEQFYDLAVQAIETTLTTVSASIACDVYWAVAEEAALSAGRWQRFSRILQGNGDLGARLHRVHSVLHQRHSAVVAIGADSPQMTPQVLIDAIELLTATPTQPTHVMGRCHDGGFYLFGARQPLDRSIWDAVPLGKSNSAAALIDQLALRGGCVQLPLLADVDLAHDLPVLRQELQAIETPTSAQVAVLKWASGMSSTQAKF